ncbi:hypothetical protein [Spirosoma utsteinense]|uniref:Uncharacterized protein n=1 Tax=Spirosoma utsteinense TaxID=2585773 RepID=A0ABR6W5W1_9BACT|nr:hypothetical protein [Spirosoma utsteinense]MBC3786349.1 hypothetical protein [Spirosoma utsteinense]MBC3791976.1 hypothetical protein [Spirosoma utsteinense]
MSQSSENLKVIFYEPSATGDQGVIVADGYFSFVPTFKTGDAINITVARKEATDPVVHNPIGHKTHHVTATDWVVMIDETSKEAVATLIVSVSTIGKSDTQAVYPSLVATH